MTDGAETFNTLDLNKAFYWLLITWKYHPFTAFSIPDDMKLQLTRMPIDAKASMAAQYQAIMDTLGETIYRYALAWPDDIMIFNKSENHIKHVDDILR